MDGVLEVENSILQHYSSAPCVQRNNQKPFTNPLQDFVWVVSETDLLLPASSQPVFWLRTKKGCNKPESYFGKAPEWQVLQL